MNKKYIVNQKTLKLVRCSEKRMNELVSHFKFCSWYRTKKEVKSILKSGIYGEILITKGFKHSNIYDIWINKGGIV